MLIFIVIIFIITLDDVPYSSSLHFGRLSIKLSSQQKGFRISFRYNDDDYPISKKYRSIKISSRSKKKLNYGVPHNKLS